MCGASIWEECIGLIVSDHTSESTFSDSNWAKGNLDTFKTVMCWHIISSVLDSAALSHKIICKRTIVNHCPWCQSLIQAREFNSAPVRLFQWPICYEIKITNNWGVTNSSGWCEQSIMRVLEWARDYKHITHDNLPQGTTCKDFFPQKLPQNCQSHDLSLLGWWQFQQRWHRPLCWYMLAWSTPLNSTNRRGLWQGTMTPVWGNPHPYISTLYWYLGRGPSWHS